MYYLIPFMASPGVISLPLLYPLEILHKKSYLKRVLFPIKLNHKISVLKAQPAKIAFKNSPEFLQAVKVKLQSYYQWI